MTALDVIMLACGTWYLSFVITQLDGPARRFKIMRDGNLLGGLFKCIYCLSLWVAIGLYALLYYKMVEVVYIVGITGAAHILAAYSGANYSDDNGGE